MPEQAPTAFGQRFMIFVPDAVPHFVLVCLENPGWSVRDYSSGHGKLLPMVALGRPIEQILKEPRPEGCIAFRAPRVATSYQRFWKCLTDELGERFLGVPSSKAIPDTDVYPLLEKDEFQKASAGLTPREVERIVGSSRSTDWISWNVVQLLLSERPSNWWKGLTESVAYLNRANRFCGNFTPKIEFWNTAPGSEAYEKWRRAHMRVRSRHPNDAVRAPEIIPDLPPMRIDLKFESSDFLLYVETRLRQGPSLDSRRNRMIRLADCLLTEAAGRPCALWFFARDGHADRECIQMVDQYRESPEMFAAELPYHPAETLYQLAERLTVISWSDVAGASLVRRVSDDPVTERVRKELRRRVGFGGARMEEGVAAATA